MEHALVVIEGKHDPTRLIQEAGQLAAGANAKLTLLYATTEEEYNQNVDSLSSYLERPDTRYSLDDAIRHAENIVEDLADETLQTTETDYSTAAQFGEIADVTLTYAAENQVDHLFLIGDKRSPTGKAIFGDNAQQIVLNFDGPTTLFTQE